MLTYSSTVFPGVEIYNFLESCRRWSIIPNVVRLSRLGGKGVLELSPMDDVRFLTCVAVYPDSNLFPRLAPGSLREIWCELSELDECGFTLGHD
jgi:hypothetical protein